MWLFVMVTYSKYVIVFHTLRTTGRSEYYLGVLLVYCETRLGPIKPQKMLLQFYSHSLYIIMNELKSLYKQWHKLKLCIHWRWNSCCLVLPLHFKMSRLRNLYLNFQMKQIDIILTGKPTRRTKCKIGFCTNMYTY